MAVRKYFDSGDYEMARAGIVSSASVGSIHACPENILSISASRSRSIDELANTFSTNHSSSSSSSSSSFGCKSRSAPNTSSNNNLHKSITFSLSSLEEQ